MPPIRVADRMDVSRPDLSTYSRIIVAFSGGKDSLAALLAVIDGLARIKRDPRGLVELWHHDVDGGESFMDWPVTTAYCQAVADAFGLPLYQSFKVGGILGEMNRAIEEQVLETLADKSTRTRLVVFGALTVPAGTPISLYPSCDRTPDTCGPRFNNMDNYGGWTDMPGDSPFGRAIF